MTSLPTLIWTYTPLPVVGFLLGAVAAAILFLIKWCFISKEPAYSRSLKGEHPDWVQPAVDSKVNITNKIE